MVVSIVTLIMKYWLTFMIAHTVADFILQTREEAKNKSKCNNALASHCTSYSIALTGYSLLFLNHNCIIPNILYWAALIFLFIFIGHFLTDYVTSRLTSRFWKLKNERAFWIVIGIDQFIHMVHITVLFIGLIAIGEKYDNSTNNKRSTDAPIKEQISRTNRI